MIATLIKLSLIWGTLEEIWLRGFSSDIKTTYLSTRRLVKECSQVQSSSIQNKARQQWNGQINSDILIPRILWSYAIHFSNHQSHKLLGGLRCACKHEIRHQILDFIWKKYKLTNILLKQHLWILCLLVWSIFWIYWAKENMPNKFYLFLFRF
jgi:hypothetical protein